MRIERGIQHRSSAHPHLVTVGLATTPLLLPLMLLLAACGDDTTSGAASDALVTDGTSVGDVATGTTDVVKGVDPSLADFCAIAAELSDQDAPPSPEQLASYAELAPAEIAAPTAIVVAAFEAADGDVGAVFADAVAVAAVEQLSAFEGEACGFAPAQDPSVTELDPDAVRIDLVATDYHFDVSLPSDAGRYSFVMTNDGAEPHLMILAHLEDGVSIDEVMASEGDTGVIRSYESGIAVPGAEAVVSLDLEPGRWVLLCPIPNGEGTPHAALGMLHEFTVV